MTQSQWADIGALIHYPEARHGVPCIAGTAMAVRTIGQLLDRGMTVDQIAKGFPSVPKSHIHAAVAFYLLNRERIDAERDQDVVPQEQAQPAAG